MRHTWHSVIVVATLARIIDPSRTVSAESPRYLFGLSTPVTELNTPGVGELQLSLTPDGLEAFFVRATFNAANDRTSSVLYTARRSGTNEPFGVPQAVAELAPPETYGDSGPSISADGLTLYFGRGVNGASKPAEEDRFPFYTIQAATRPSRNAPFGPPTEVTGLKAPDDIAGILRPEISADGLSLYMQRVHLDPRDSDVYVSHRQSVSDPWEVAVPIAEFSTSDPAHYLWESAPGLTADGQGIFLERGWYAGDSTDLPDMRNDSGQDIYFAQRIDQGWSPAVNLGSTINDPAGRYQTDPFLTADGSTLYFNRALYPDGPTGTTWDLYQAPVLPFSAEALNGSGGSYTQNFDVMGSDSKAFTSIPAGWTFTANDVVFNNVTTARFPASPRRYVGVYNAGTTDAEDRALVTDVTALESGELDLRTLVTGDALQALRLEFDLEAWQVRTLGEAAFHVVLEADSGNGFQQIRDLGEFSTGKTLVRPAAGGNRVDGNDPAYRHSFDTGPIDVGLVPAGTTLRMRWIGTDSSQNVVFGLDNVSLHFAMPGDANADGAFDSDDLIRVFQVGEYEDAVVGNSSWAEGDWNNDLEFDSEDLTAAFQVGHYQDASPATAAVPEPTSLLLPIFGGLAAYGRIVTRRRR